MLKKITNSETQKVKKSLSNKKEIPAVVSRPVEVSPCVDCESNATVIIPPNTNNGFNCCLTEYDIYSDVEIGGINPGDKIPKGTSLTDFIYKLLTKTFYPSFVDPVFSLGNDSEPYVIIGSPNSFHLIFTTDRGKILGREVNNVWLPEEFQNYRIGTPISFLYYYPNDLPIGSTPSSVLYLMDYIVEQGLNTFKAIQTFNQGAQPYDSKGLNYSTPYPAGASPIVDTAFEGVYPIYATTVARDVATQQTLYSMISGNNIELTLVAEKDSSKQFFEIPTVWLDARPLTKIQYFFGHDFHETNKIDEWIQSDTTKEIYGNTVNYTKFLNNSLLRGLIKIKLVF